MFDTSETTPLAVLVGVDLGEYDLETSMAELEELAEADGIRVVATMTQKRPALDPGTCIGEGRLQELAELCSSTEVDLLIFDHELTGSQMRNIEEATDTPVIDRTTLILDIFATRATTSEGRLQVELAQQRYRLPRLQGYGQKLSRLGGGIGTRGPGETKLETDRRHIHRRILSLERQLEDLSRRRETLRQRRKKDGVTTVAIVGYTNVGKSSLLNALTDAGVLAENKLFVTLNPTSRALLLPDGRSVLLIDTVGLVRRLPHHLVDAFHSTLEEASQADLLLNVCDVSSEEVQEQVRVTEALFHDLGVKDTPIVTVLNKCDLLETLPDLVDPLTVLISAKTGYGFDDLLQTIARILSPTQSRLRLLIPYDKSSLLSTVRIEGKVFSEEYLPDGTLADCLVDHRILHLVQDYIQKP